MKETLKQMLLDKINATDTWLSKGQLYLVAEQEEYSPENCGRTLRLLAEENKILVSYYKGKRGQTLAKYARLDTPKVIKPKIELKEINGQRVAVMS
jgi:hypothetical protein